ncbi:AAA family ATPase [Propioniciclava coleopterorum]|uniref:AAA family ATPase n=1 Tax=Propioniciclava coleopterorum TaxID=2714937 RepID=A0A6G7Y6V1_9ACTN|nr:RNA polymerase recycling motor ATPase HelR [Propioniciclava coleopterorum]QIK72542.1 AAA family ATPase [Propioniciclava coleopterorum]
MSDPIFHLPPRLAAKADPSRIGADEAHLSRVAATLDAQAAALASDLDRLRAEPAGRGRKALDRDLDIHRLSGRLGILRRFGRDVCLGRVVAPDGTVTFIGRIGATGPEEEPLLIDWRTPAAEPFFAATAAEPRGVASRRRYRWSLGRIVDYWDELLHPDAGPAARAGLALDDDSAFLASLGERRTGRMRDVLTTIAADQDAVIRADSRGALVVEGGPGTGKTVAALHRAAYLLYADPRLGGHRGGVLVVGPHQPYLDYVADVLPSLGEEGVRTCTPADLVPEAADAIPEPDPRVAALKASLPLVAAIEPAVALYEEPPTDDTALETGWGDVAVTADDWAQAFAEVDPGTPHNEARDDVWDALLTQLVEREAGEEPDELRADLARNAELRDQFRTAWPILHADDLVADLWAVPAYLRRCVPGIDPEDARALRRPEGSPWTDADLPLLDAMRARLGDPQFSAKQQERRASLARDRAEMDEVVDYLLRTDDDPDSGLQYLRRASIREALVDESGFDDGRDPLAGPFAHIVVDEAQELTDAQWAMLIRRCPSRSFTIVGDRAQARGGFAEAWEDRLGRLGFDHVRRAELTVNYRTPQEVMDVAAPIILAALPDASVPTSIRRAGIPVRHGSPGDLDAVVSDWLATHDGVACIIGTGPLPAPRERVLALPPEQAKGLEFDLVVLLDPDAFGPGVAGAVDRYVAMTRATQELVLLR